MRARVGVDDSANLFELLDTVLERGDQTQRGAMVRCQRLAVQLIGQQRLRMERHFALDADIILAVRRLEADVLRNATRQLLGIRLIATLVEWRGWGEGEAEAGAPPPKTYASPLPTPSSPHPLSLSRVRSSPPAA